MKNQKRGWKYGSGAGPWHGKLSKNEPENIP